MIKKLDTVLHGAYSEFTNQDFYALAPHFEKLHPGNRHVRDKLRQQLQNLRDLGLLTHIAPGRWRRLG